MGRLRPMPSRTTVPRLSMNLLAWGRGRFGNEELASRDPGTALRRLGHRRPTDVYHTRKLWVANAGPACALVYKARQLQDASKL